MPECAGSKSPHSPAPNGCRRWRTLKRSSARRRKFPVSGRSCSYSTTAATTVRSRRPIRGISKTPTPGRNETMASYRPIFERARRDGVELTGAIATAFGCPFEGDVDREAPLRLAAHFVEAGVAEVDLADTVGMAVPNQIKPMLKRARREFPRVRLG